MIQDKVKVQLDQIKKQGEKLQVELGKGLGIAKVEGQRILKEFGVDTTEQLDMKDVLADLRKANPSVRQFLRNLDVATYDARFRLNWNATMISAYAKQQAGKTYSADVKPRLDEFRDIVSQQLHEIQVKTKQLTAKISA